MSNSMQGYKKVLSILKHRQWMQQYKDKLLHFKNDIHTKGLKRWVLLRLLPLRKLTTKASFTQWMYWLSLFLVILWFVRSLGVILNIFNSETLLIASNIFIGGVSGCATIGFASEVIPLLTTYWKNPIFKNFVYLLGLTATTLSIVASRLLINFFTKIDPSHLPIAVSILTTLLTPILWLGLIVIALISIYITLTILLPISFNLPPFLEVVMVVRNSYIYRFFLHKRKVPYNSLLFWKQTVIWASRSFGIAGTAFLLILLIFFVHNRAYHYKQQISQLVTDVIVYSNYQFNNDECKNFNRGEWVKYIGNTGSHKISVAVPQKAGGYAFETRTCN